MTKATSRSDRTTLRDEVVRRVRQFDSVRDGPREWGLQRLTAIAVIPLSLYFAASVLSLATSDRRTAADWLSLPVLALVVILVVLAGITHALIGVRSVVLDYVHTRIRWWPSCSHRSSKPCKSSVVRWRSENLAPEARDL
jgi:succinate dehydrogenase / fumarate reductase membrane anchor subunit